MKEKEFLFYDYERDGKLSKNEILLVYENGTVEKVKELKQKEKYSSRKRRDEC